MYHVLLNGDIVKTRIETDWDFDDDIGDKLVSDGKAVKNDNGTFTVNPGIEMVVVFPVVIDDTQKYPFPVDCALKVGDDLVSAEFDYNEIEVVSLANEKYMRGIEIAEEALDKEVEV